MKAFLLAAGLGTRLRPITDTLPKTMVEIGGQPLLDIWLDALCAAGVTDVLINLHHLPHMVRKHVESRGSSPRVHLVEEPELLGSAGTLAANRAFVADQSMFLVINADNLTDFGLRTLIDAHRASNGIATLALFHAPHPSACGIVEVDGHGRMVGFEEKPQQPKSDLANAGMYAFGSEVLDLIEGSPPQDIGNHLLPRLIGLAHTVPIEGHYFIDIGTPAALDRARLEWKGGDAL